MSHRDDVRELRALEDELRRLAPEPEFEYFHALEHSLLEPPAPSRERPSLSLRVGLAGGLTAVVVGGLAVTGGLSYAASSVAGVAKIVRHAASPRQAIVVRGLSAGGDQYRPGYGFGDPNHNHTGPPGLTRQDRKAGALAPPLQAKATHDGFGSTVSTSVNFDEQAHLYISVIDAADTPLLLTQRSKRGGSTVGAGVAGPQTKFIQYAVLVPRTIPITLRIPVNLLLRGQTYRLRIVAFDPQGNRSQLLIPFRA